MLGFGWAFFLCLKYREVMINKTALQIRGVHPCYPINKLLDVGWVEFTTPNATTLKKIRRVALVFQAF